MPSSFLARGALAFLCGIFLSIQPLVARAQNALEGELQAAFEAARPLIQKGPAQIALADQARLDLAEGFVFVPRAPTQRILKAMGNTANSDVLGMIFPSGENDSNWFMVAMYEPAGYIKDDDAKDWNADDLLNSLKEGTVTANAERRARGIPEMEVLGWVEKPAYDSSLHRLVWSVSSRDKVAPAGALQGVNYNTYALGRNGFISLNLVTDLNSVETRKPIAKRMLAALEFNDGKRYGDFNSSTDKVAEYGLAALVAGVAAKKLGLIALVAAFVAKFAKILILGALALLGAVAKFWKRGAEENSPVTAEAQDHHDVPKT
jgi:uncharacterized membrane-anchored protein